MENSYQVQRMTQCNKIPLYFFFPYFSVGKTKIVAGAGLGILGALTGNAQLQQAGGGLVGLGVASSLGAHLLGKKKKWKKKWNNEKLWNYISYFHVPKLKQI